MESGDGQAENRKFEISDGQTGIIDSCSIETVNNGSSGD
jgi:hypothetical protein